MTEQRWGDPTAQFPYCLDRAEYDRQMREVATSGLGDDQLAGNACVRCGAVLSIGKVKAGSKRLTWSAVDGSTELTVHDLFVGPCCGAYVSCPEWCSRDHQPFILAHEWLDCAIHEHLLGTILQAVGSPAKADCKVTVNAHETGDGLSDAYVNVDHTDLELDATKCRQLAAALLDGADLLDQVTATTPS